MKGDRFTKLLLALIVALLFISLVVGLFPLQQAVAQKSVEGIGRYQISAWAAQTGQYGFHHSGYFIVDTVTGKVVEERGEAHGIEH
jgi:hypothetical protein